ncbi:MAG: hypothetical protein BWK78_03970 [Thiotrichaceae bacterium IS1]|nr:MAG: hypothetical protein BWK78_03970 [Thiotrichaceae bacterium IS1]
MPWQKLGRVFCPENNYEWMVSHAANPVAKHLQGDLFRIYFSSRDSENRSSIGFVEIDIKRPDQFLKLCDKPVVQPGERGGFDDSGTSMGGLVTVGKTEYLYYLGWNLGVTVPWRNSIGLAINDSSEPEFAKYSKAPILDRSAVDPYSISYPWVRREESIWKMWYGSNLKWGSQQTDMAHVIKYAESLDGIIWQRTGTIAIDFKSAEEYAISKPCVLKEDGRYKMWYSYRGTFYRIGYAESEDGIHWTRMDDQVGIDVSESGWDSDMIEYPQVFDHQGRRYMLYNGNGYGRTGFGVAVLVEE